MAEEIKNQQKSHEYEQSVGTEGAVETRDRGMLDFLGKKEEAKPQHHDQEVIATEFEKVHVSEPQPKVEGHRKEEEEGEKKPGLLDKLHRSNSSSSSSSDEEGGDDEEKKKKKKEKKGLKEKLKGKISGEKEEDTTVPVEKLDDVHAPHHQEEAHPEEKKGFLDKIKEKLPGQQKKPEDHQVTSPPPAEHASSVEAHDGEAKEKKGILEKLKEKIPGYHPKSEDEKEKDKETAAH